MEVDHTLIRIPAFEAGAHSVVLERKKIPVHWLPYLLCQIHSVQLVAWQHKTPLSLETFVVLNPSYGVGWTGLTHLSVVGSALDAMDMGCHQTLWDSLTYPRVLWKWIH